MNGEIESVKGSVRSGKLVRQCDEPARDEIRRVFGQLALKQRPHESWRAVGEAEGNEDRRQDLNDAQGPFEQERQNENQVGYPLGVERVRPSPSPKQGHASAFIRASSTSKGTPGSSLASRMTSEVFTLATLSAEVS